MATADLRIQRGAEAISTTLNTTMSSLGINPDAQYLEGTLAEVLAQRVITAIDGIQHQAEPTRDQVLAGASALQEEMQEFMQPGSYGWMRFAKIAMTAARASASRQGV